MLKRARSKMLQWCSYFWYRLPDKVMGKYAKEIQEFRVWQYKLVLLIIILGI